jgi:hypothetical protein
MTADNDRSRLGTRNRRAGRGWELDCAKWMRANGWANVEREFNFGRGDLVGTGDFHAECTITSWAEIWEKLRQAERDACSRGLAEWGVWRKQRNAGDPGRGVMVVPADQFWRMRAELEAFRRADGGERR